MRRLLKTLPLKIVFIWLTFNPLAAQAATSTLRDLVKKPLRLVAEKAFLIKPGDKTERSPLDLFGLYLNLMLAFVGVVFIVQVVHGGYLWMTASGNEEQLKKAQSKITNGAVGAAIVFLAYVVTAFVLYLVTDWAGVPGGFEEAAPAP